MQTIYKQRPAIAMIELIFALVIMGITMMSAPLLISQATKSNFVAFQQESIAIAASHANALMTYAWDEQNTQSQINYTYTILKVSNNADPELKEGNRTLPGKRQFNIPDINATASTVLGADVVFGGNEYDDDIDDFIDANQTLTLAAAATNGSDTGEYIDQNIVLNTQVSYMDDTTLYGAATGVVTYNIPKTLVTYSTNIKYITVSLTSLSDATELNTKQITLRSFMCNIGGAKPNSQGLF